MPQSRLSAILDGFSPNTNAADSSQFYVHLGKEGLLLFNLYRFALAGCLLLLFHLDSTYPALGRLNPELFLAGAVAYLGFSMVTLLTISYQPARLDSRIATQITIDLFLLLVMMHTSQMRSGFAVLISVAIAASGLLLPGRRVYCFAVLALSLVALEHAINCHLQGSTFVFTTEIGLLAASFFATALITHELASRVRVSESLVRHKQQTIEQLASLNEEIIARIQTAALVVNDKGMIDIINEAARPLLNAHAGRAYEAGRLSLQAFNAELHHHYHGWQQASNTLTSPSWQHQDVNFTVQFHPLQDHANHTLILLDNSLLTQQKAQQLKLSALGQLTASIAHEVRNPIGAISHAAQLLEESALTEEQNTLVNIIDRQSNRINRLVNSILQLSREKKSAPVWFHLQEWLQDFDVSALRAEYPSAEINMVCDPSLPSSAELHFDKEHLTQILTNCFSNGLRHSVEAGHGPSVQLVTRMDAARQSIILDITDKGQGVSEAVSEQLFEPFYTTSANGTGLGLYIVKQLLALGRAQIRAVPSNAGGHFSLQFYETRMRHE